MTLMQLTYISSPFGFDESTLAGILMEARRCNARDGITGSLIVREDIYCQLLEGPASAVDAAFGRIRRDGRHCQVQLMSRRNVGTRLFPEWTMRDDPVRSWMWTMDEVARGVPRQANEDDVVGIFERLAGEAYAGHTPNGDGTSGRDDAGRG
jgi:hypothetical protein